MNTQLIFGALKESISITLIIFFLMIVIEILVLKFKSYMFKFMKKNNSVKYIISSFFGIIPGCVGTFAMDSLYMSGLLTFGGIISVMVATSGDEAFIMLGMVAKGDISLNSLLLLISSLFIIGIFAGILSDIIKNKFKMKTCEKCRIINHEKEELKFKHFIKEHLYNHILKKHIWKIFIWIFLAIYLISLLDQSFSLEFNNYSLFVMLIIASLIGILPISGPNAFLLVMFSKGYIPFSILLANSIIQDGHGLLPIMGYSINDSIKIKVFNFILGLGIGILLLSMGL